MRSVGFLGVCAEPRQGSRFDNARYASRPILALAPLAFPNVDLHITLDGTGSLTRQIYDQIRNAILSGRLQAGDPVPSSRELAASLGVARNTVASAVDHLRAEGYLSARPGVGTSVSDEYRRAEPSYRPQPAAVLPVALWRSDRFTVPDYAAPNVVFDFRAGIPDSSRFPFPTWRRLIDHESRRSNDAGRYGDPAGPRPTREAIARHLAISRGLHASPDDVVITNGVQQAVTLLSQILIEPGDVVAIEDPGYPPARHAFESVRATLAPTPVDEQGIVVDRLPTNARLVYVTPAHQFPLGVRMSLARRAALLDWAEANGAAIIEDDYDTDFHFGGWPIDPLHTLDDSGRGYLCGVVLQDHAPESAPRLQRRAAGADRCPPAGTLRCRLVRCAGNSGGPRTLHCRRSPRRPRA